MHFVDAHLRLTTNLMHTIRLRGPWQRQFGDEPAVRATVPDDDAGTATHACYRRRFHCPTGLGKADRVFLRITDWVGQVDAIQVNGQPLTITNRPLCVEITSHLQKHNELCVFLVVEKETGDGPRLSGEVSLQIEGVARES